MTRSRDLANLGDNTSKIEQQGLVQVIASSVAAAGVGSSGSVDSKGNVTFSTCTGISLNGVFSSTYQNYRIVVNLTSAATDFNFIRLRVSGSDNSTASSYISERFRATGTTLTGLRNTDSTLLVGAGENGTYVSMNIEVFSPAEARPTQFIVNRTERQADSDTEFSAYGGYHNQSVAYTGFTLYGTKSTSGTIRVYGYNQ
jgi:hypothetical protein